MNVITAPGPVTFAELETNERLTHKQSQEAIERIVKEHIERCFGDADAKKEDITHLVRNYLLQQQIPTRLNISPASLWSFWSEYFMNAVMLEFPLKNRRIAAWAFVSLSTENQYTGVLSLLISRKMQTCFDFLRIPFDQTTDLVVDSSRVTNALSPRILCDIATMFGLPTDFNTSFNFWNGPRRGDCIDLIKATDLDIPPLKEFKSDCAQKRKPEGPGHPDPYDRNF